jgi:hypothetical protein
MPSWFWISLWVLVIAGVAVLYVREKRSGRKPVDTPERGQHLATQEAEVNRARFGPNGPAGTWGG